MSIIQTIKEKWENFKDKYEETKNLVYGVYDAKYKELEDKHGDPEELDTSEAVKKIVADEFTESGEDSE